MRLISKKPALFVSAAIIALCVNGNAWAQTHSFDIPAEDANKAIPEFARQAGIQIVAPGDQLKGVRTAAVKGNLDTCAALAQLLVGTPAKIASNDGQTIILAVPSKNDSAASSDGAAGVGAGHDTAMVANSYEPLPSTWCPVQAEGSLPSQRPVFIRRPLPQDGERSFPKPFAIVTRRVSVDGDIAIERHRFCPRFPPRLCRLNPGQTPNDQSLHLAREKRETGTALPDADSKVIDQSIIDKLKLVSTATIATALYKRGLRSQMIQGVLPLGPIRQTMVGIAYTLRYIPAREDLNRISVFNDPKHPQRAAIEGTPPGAVLVIDSRGDARAASAGSILVRRLMMRDGAGIVTDGGFRDSAEIATLEMPAFHRRPSAPTNLTLHQAVDVNVPIACGDAPVFPGDVIVGDADGAIVIPADIAADVAEEATSMTMYEDFVVEMVSQGRSIVGLYPLTDRSVQDEFEKWRAINER